MTYLTTQEKYGRTETIVDVGAFAADLAKELGYALLPKNDEMYDDYRYIAVSPDLNLTVYSNRYQCKGRVSVSATATIAKTEDRPYADDKGTYKMPQAWVSVERPMKTIARDVKRRVVEAAATPLANTLDYVAKRKAQRSDLASTVAELAKAVPELRPANNGTTSDGYSQTLYWNGPGPYMGVRVYATGDVGIDQIGNVPLAAFVEIAEVLRKYAKKEAA